MNDYDKRRLLRHLDAAVRYYVQVLSALDHDTGNVRQLVADAMADARELATRLKQPHRSN